MKIEDITPIRDGSRSSSNDQVPFSSNCVRLSPSEWLIVAAVFSAVFYFAPMLWERVEKFEPASDYRLPYDLSSDYWLYERYCRWACSNYDTLVVGDSVVWGHLVPSDNTLSHHLNNLAGRPQFANLGADGTHPAALEGLLRYYATDISNKNVILHLNPLWMTSPKQDLQTEKEHHFNHPKLVPQFTPKIPCYKASFPTRISTVINRNVPFFNFSSHLNITWFQSMDVPAWTLEHPYENPLSSVTLNLPTSDNYERPNGTARPGRGVGQTTLQWVELETSLQWLFFRRSIRLLRKRNNRVFVIVGPFNEHKLDADGIDTYRSMQAQIETWLRRNNVPYYMPDVLPSHLYVDASHPLGAGYAALAKQLFENVSFTSYILSINSNGAD
ncbi:MAG: hypothetical protein WBC22_07865 [Sedimentisphaerales bacterium]